MSDICLVCGCNAVLCSHNTAYPDSLLRALFGDCDDYAEQMCKLVVDDATISILNGNGEIEQRHGRYIVQPYGKSIVAQYGKATAAVPFIDIGFYKYGVKFFVSGVEYRLLESVNSSNAEHNDCISNASLIGQKSHENVCTIDNKKIRLGDVIFEVVRAVCDGNLEIEKAVRDLSGWLTDNKLSISTEIAELKKAYERGKISAEPMLLVMLSYFPHASDAGSRYRLPFALDDMGMLIRKSYDEVFAVVRLGACNLYPDKRFKIHLSELCKTKVGGTSAWDIVVKNVYKISPVSDKRYISEIKPFLDRLF